MRKGSRVGPRERRILEESGVTSIWVGKLAATEVDEDESARRIAAALSKGAGLQCVVQRGGRVTLMAGSRSVLRINEPLLLRLLALDGVTLATLPNHSAVEQHQAVATLKVIPFALQESVVRQAEGLAGQRPLRVVALLPRRVCMLLFGANGSEQRVRKAFVRALTGRLARLGTPDPTVEFVAVQPDAVGPDADDMSVAQSRLAHALARQLDRSPDLLIVAGDSATMDYDDLVPSAVRCVGGEVDALGAPVFPGNLLLLAHRGSTSLLGAPGCVRTPASNVVDLLLPRLLVGERLTRAEVARLSLGGLLSGRTDSPRRQPGATLRTGTS